MPWTDADLKDELNKYESAARLVNRQRVWSLIIGLFFVGYFVFAAISDSGSPTVRFLVVVVVATIVFLLVRSFWRFIEKNNPDWEEMAEDRRQRLAERGLR